MVFLLIIVAILVVGFCIAVPIALYAMLSGGDKRARAEKRWLATVPPEHRERALAERRAYEQWHLQQYRTLPPVQ